MAQNLLSGKRRCVIDAGLLCYKLVFMQSRRCQQRHHSSFIQHCYLRNKTILHILYIKDKPGKELIASSEQLKVFLGNICMDEVLSFQTSVPPYHCLALQTSKVQFYINNYHNGCTEYFDGV